MTHQTMRSDAKGKMRRDRFKTRDWDYLGWKYSVISSIASAPYNHVVNYIPARDMDEFKAFSAADKAWFNKWLDWTDEEMDVLREHRPIMGQPMVGKVDGWAAFKGGDGFVFLFNPNYRQMDAEFKLGVEVGLKKKGRYLMRVMYPDAEKGMYVGHPTKGYWEYGDDVSIAMEGTQAKVLEVVEFDGKVGKPMLFGAVGKVAPKWGSIAVTDCKGKVGSSSDIVVMLKKDKRVKKLTVNGKKTKFKQDGNKLLATVKFAGVEMDRTPQIGVYDAKFTGGVYKAKFSVPERVFAQLKQRKKDWPIPYTEDDLCATWIGSDRLLLYVQIADPKEDMVSTLKIDGKEVELTKAYSSTYRSNPKHTYLGEYVDVSHLEPNKEYAIEVTLPELEAGRFQGLFLENIESEYTDEIAKK